MFGPGAYRPDPTEGITALADLPQPEIVSAANSLKYLLCVARCFVFFHRYSIGL